MNDGDICPICDEGTLIATGQQDNKEWFRCRNQYCNREFSEPIEICPLS